MSKRTQSIRGMHDILPAQSAIWQALEIRVKDLVSAYGYREIRLPIVEHTELFTRSIGEVTDIVEKEMYTFEDRNCDSLSLRPEGTASCVRAGIEHGLFHNQQQRLWYIGPMFRHERPQKGRYRQFHQIGIETFGFAGPDIDAELIFMSARLWDVLGLKNIRLELNSLGTPAVRERYREKLINYLMLHQDTLDEDARRRMHTNPMRVLDSKNPDMKDVIEGAPNLLDHLDDESQRHFEELKEMLAAANIPFMQNSRLVRGLDYYTKTVFEWTSDQLGAQATICAGGRYDGLVEKLGGRATPAAGFAMGLERMIDLLEVQGIALAQDRVHAYLVMAGERVLHSGQELAEKLRNEISDLRLITNCGAGSFKAQLKRADRSGAELALILGEDEISEGAVTVKFLRSEQNQKKIPHSQLATFLRSHLTIQ